MNKVNILGTDCLLEFGKYGNGTVSIAAINDGVPFLTLTVNWEENWGGFFPYKKVCKFPVVVIKGYSENTGVPKNLIDVGVVTGGAYMENTNGSVEVMRLTPEWISVAKKQIQKRYSLVNQIKNNH